MSNYMHALIWEHCCFWLFGLTVCTHTLACVVRVLGVSAHVHMYGFAGLYVYALKVYRTHANDVLYLELRARKQRDVAEKPLGARTDPVSEVACFCEQQHGFLSPLHVKIRMDRKHVYISQSCILRCLKELFWWQDKIQPVQGRATVLWVLWAV